MKAQPTQKQPLHPKGQYPKTNLVLTKIFSFAKTMLPLFSAILVLAITLMPVSPDTGIKGWADVVKTKVACELKSYYDQFSTTQEKTDQPK